MFEGTRATQRREGPRDQKTRGPRDRRTKGPGDQGRGLKDLEIQRPHDLKIAYKDIKGPKHCTSAGKMFFVY